MRISDLFLSVMHGSRPRGPRRAVRLRAANDARGAIRTSRGMRRRGQGGLAPLPGATPPCCLKILCSCAVCAVSFSRSGQLACSAGTDDGVSMPDFHAAVPVRAPRAQHQFLPHRFSIAQRQLLGPAHLPVAAVRARAPRVSGGGGGGGCAQSCRWAPPPSSGDAGADRREDVISVRFSGDDEGAGI